MSTPTDNDDSPPPAHGQRSLVPLVAAIGFCLGLLMVLAHPYFNSLFLGGLRPRAAPKWACISNLKQIDGAVQRWAMEHGKGAADSYTLTDTVIVSYMKGSVLPICPLGGKYTPGKNVSEVPHCTIPGHTL